VVAAHTLLTGAVSGLGLTVSAGYFLRRLIKGDDPAARALWAKLDLADVYERRTRRRSLGMAIMALISVVFFVGANDLSPDSHPRVALLFWVVLLILLLWLCLLAFVDLAEARELRKRLLAASREMFFKDVSRCSPTNSTQTDDT
jgi:uncharacterized membrane protein